MHLTRTVTAAVADFFRGVTLLHFRGGGLNDATFGGTYTGFKPLNYLVRISTAAGTDQYQYSTDSGQTWSVAANITAGPDALSNGVTVTFGATTGHTLLDEWVVSAFRVARSNIGTAPFTGTVLDDLTPSGTYEGYNYLQVRVIISTAAATDLFQVSFDGGLTYGAEIAITGAAQHIGYGILITFAATTGHGAGDYWDIEVTPPGARLLVDGVYVQVDTVSANDEIFFQDEDGNDRFLAVSINAIGNFDYMFDPPIVLRVGKDIDIATTGSQFSAAVTISATLDEV